MTKQRKVKRVVRLFNNKYYYWYKEHKSKTKVNKIVRKLRKEGWLVRIVSLKDMYAIYRRKAK